jgi:endonuclease/exonuclease/phosphatase family metal-dependent hydrolase
VVCLQEVVWRRNLALLRGRAASYPHAAYRAFGPAITGGLVTLSRWPIERQRYVVYRVRAVGPVPRIDWLVRKGLLITDFQVAGQPLTIVNTHLLANSDGDWSRANTYARGEQAELSQLAEELNGIEADASLVVAGDLNVPRDAWLFDEFLGRAGLTDVLAGRAGPTYRPTPRFSASKAIDHVLVRPSPGSQFVTDARPVFQERVSLRNGRSLYLSDHYGIEARLELRRLSAT